MNPSVETQSALQTFVEESRELLREMEQALLRLERDRDDADAVNAVFRAAHTIKGSSGVFGLDAIVGFAHTMESMLEAVRAGEVPIDADAIGLLLACGDHLETLVDRAAAGEAADDEATAQTGRGLAARLCACLPEAAGATEGPATPAADAHWHISLRFGADVLRHGLDPLSFLRYLATLGELVDVQSLFDAMPPADAMDPEACCLGLEIVFRGDVDKETLEGAFDFVRDDCEIRILPPHSRIADYIALIDELPEEKTRLGELLVSSGVLTRRELEVGLREQRALRAGDPSGAVAPSSKLGRVLVGQGAVPETLVDAALERQAALKEHKASESCFVRVHAGKLDELITLVGELVIAGAGTRLLALRTGSGELVESTSTMERLAQEVRDSALKLRMVPIAETFGRFRRVVRDLGRELGKDVELVESGIETEVDKSMAERIVDPIMHLVRNALDHGIEPPARRLELGKSAKGKLFLNAFHDSGTIVIEVGDDGAGLDRRRILEVAAARGLVPRGAELADAEVYGLVMQPGFSTAEAVTSVSGRGIGMDVVRRNVEALRGSVTIDSVAGQGTTVSVRLPLTLAIIDGFAVGVGRASYVIPLDTVVECIELAAEERTAVRARNYINLRDRVLPVVRLRDVFGVPGEAGRRENVVVVQYAGRQAGFVVDSLMGEFQAVIKPLGKLFERLSGISGSTILGNGEVALILDVAALVHRAEAADTQQGGALARTAPTGSNQQD